MKATSIQTRIVVAVVLGLAASAAQAHPGHGGLMSGLLHPWGGPDHMAAMLAVGLWAMTLQGSKRLLLPVVFVLATLAGALLPVSQMFLAVAEQGIVLSLLAMGGGLLMALRMPWHAAVLLMGAAGLCHGYAHAAEIPAGESVQAFVAGMLASTSALHLLGVGLALLTSRFRPEYARYWGAPVALVGAMGLIG